MKYRKKPVVIEAEIYRLGLEDGFDPDWSAPQSTFNVKCGQEITQFPCKPFINTLEGKHYISPGDYIITGIKGERYPCKPDIFAATYDKVMD